MFETMPLSGRTIYFLGKLAASNRKEAAELVRRGGGKVVRDLGPSVNIVVVGEGDVLSRDWNLWNDQLDAATREAFERGALEIVSEAFFWDRCKTETPDAVVPDTDEKTATAEPPLYTPSMLVELSGLPISTIRLLQRRRLLLPSRQVHRLPYFDFQDVLLLKIVRNMLDAGVSLNVATTQLQKFRRRFPCGPLNVNIEGKDVLFLTENGPVDQDGQLRFPFVWDVGMPAEPKTPKEFLETLDEALEPTSFDFDALCSTAWELESSGDLSAAVELYRTTLAAHGSNAQLNFQLAEILYRLGDLSAARERYFVAVELDEEFVEARANLGCVLAELGSDDLAVSAFRGALRYHPEYAEVRFHLGMLLCRLGLEEEGAEHLRFFLALTPDSPWASKALEKIAEIEG